MKIYKVTCTITSTVDNVKYYSQVKATYSGKKDWEPEEDNYIKNNLNTSLIEMAKHLGRSISSVFQRKHKIVNGLLYMKQGGAE